MFECEFSSSYNMDKVLISISLIDKRGSKPDVMRWVRFSDDNLKDGFYNFTPIYEPLMCN